MFAAGGPDWKRLCEDGPLILLVGALEVLLVLGLADLDVTGLDSDLICLALDAEDFVFFTESLDVDFACFSSLLPSTLGDGCVSPAVCVGVFTLRTPRIFSCMRCMERVTC